MTQLNRDFILNEWVPALRSKEYRQGTEWLHPSPGSFCCLGVACDVLAKSGQFAGRWAPPEVDGDPIEFVIGSEVATGSLPIEVAKFTGITDDGELDLDPDGDDFVFHVWGKYEGTDFRCLASANDSGVPFSTIADWLEAAANDEAVTS